MVKIRVNPLVEILMSAVLLSTFAGIITDPLEDYAKTVPGWYNETSGEWVGAGKAASAVIDLMVPLAVVFSVGFGLWHYAFGKK